MILKSAIVLTFLGLVYHHVSAASLNVEGNDVAINSQKSEVKQLQSLLAREILENAALRSQLKKLIEMETGIMQLSVNDDDDDDENNNNNNNNNNSGDDNDENDEENDARRRAIAIAGRRAKRFPKWRSGDTRSRVRLLYQNDGRHLAPSSHHISPSSSSSSSSSSSLSSSPSSSADYSALLRNRWENNMLEKNKMYQNLLG